jgi:hypothetical protein
MMWINKNLCATESFQWSSTCIKGTYTLEAQTGPKNGGYQGPSTNTKGKKRQLPTVNERRSIQ